MSARSVQQGVEVATDAYLTEITPDGMTVTAGDFHTTTIPADTVGISIGLEPDRELYHSLQGSLPSVYLAS